MSKTPRTSFKKFRIACERSVDVRRSQRRFPSAKSAPGRVPCTGEAPPGWPDLLEPVLKMTACELVGLFSPNAGKDQGGFHFCPTVASPRPRSSRSEAGFFLTQRRNEGRGFPISFPTVASPRPRSSRSEAGFFLTQRRNEGRGFPIFFPTVASPRRCVKPYSLISSASPKAHAHDRKRNR